MENEKREYKTVTVLIKEPVAVFDIIDEFVKKKRYSYGKFAEMAVSEFFYDTNMNILPLMITGKIAPTGKEKKRTSIRIYKDTKASISIFVKNYYITIPGKRNKKQKISESKFLIAVMLQYIFLREPFYNTDNAENIIRRNLARTKLAVYDYSTLEDNSQIELEDYLIGRLALPRDTIKEVLDIYFKIRNPFKDLFLATEIDLKTIEYLKTIPKEKQQLLYITLLAADSDFTLNSIKTTYEQS